jgi:hypothetical protein
MHEKADAFVKFPRRISDGRGARQVSQRKRRYDVTAQALQRMTDGHVEE